VSCYQRTLRGDGHIAAGWGIGGSVIAADCGVQSSFIWTPTYLMDRKVDKPKFLVIIQ